MIDAQYLLERIDKATVPDRELDCLIYCAVCPGFTIHDRIAGSVVRGDERPPVIVDRLTASIDAALALAERVLPGWKMHFHLGGGLWGEQSPGATICEPSFAALSRKNKPYMQGKANARTLPLAICIALLRALSKETDTNE